MTRLDRLSANDLLFLDVETDTSVMNVAAGLVFDGRSMRLADGNLDFERILKHLTDCVGRHRRYGQRVGKSPIARRSIWIDAPSFDASDHIRSLELDPRAHGGGLGEICAKFAVAPLDRERPLWEALIVDGLAGNRFAIVVKAHHCLADGVGGIVLLESLLAPRRGDEITPHPRQPRANLVADEILDEIDAARRTLKSVRDSIRSPGERWSSFWPAIRGLAEAARLGLNPAIQTRLDVDNSRSRALRWIETDLDRIHAIRAARGGTVNDVVIATVALALGRYLESHGFTRDGLSRATFRVAVPVNMRSTDASPRIGNDISMMFAEIPVGEADPIRVLDRTRESVAAAKEAETKTALRTLMDAGSRLPRAWVQGIERWVLTQHLANIVLTNIRGPRIPLSLLDAPLESVIPIVPLMPGQALAIAVASYAGRLFWGLHADAAQFEDPDEWASCVALSFDDLSRSATPDSTRGAPES